MQIKNLHWKATRDPLGAEIVDLKMKFEAAKKQQIWNEVVRLDTQVLLANLPHRLA